MLQSALPTEFPHVDFAAAPIGIFGKKVKDSAPLREGDRVEVYRALLIDPKRKSPPQSRCQTEKRGYLKAQSALSPPCPHHPSNSTPSQLEAVHYLGGPLFVAGRCRQRQNPT